MILQYDIYKFKILIYYYVFAPNIIFNPYAYHTLYKIDFNDFSNNFNIFKS